jgi:hypothetical protein
MPEIFLPNEFTPRPYQNDLMSYFDHGGLRAACVWHRRSGKDMTMLHQAAKMAMQRVGGYYHMLPEFSQARKVIWDAIDIDGNRMIDQAFPHEIRADTHIADMKITFHGGSYWQLVGSDRYDALMGTNPVGVTFSEYSIADPTAWDYIQVDPRDQRRLGLIHLHTPRPQPRLFDVQPRERKPEVVPLTQDRGRYRRREPRRNRRGAPRRNARGHDPAGVLL